MENIIVIGSGPAGHTAAIYAARAMLKPLMFEGFLAGGIAAGGQLTTTTEVENRPWEPNGIQWPELMDRMRQQSINCGTTIISETIEKVDLSKRPYTVSTASQTRETKTIIIATGATAKRLDAPGVNDYRNKGISGCAVCDGALPIFRNKVLGIIGGWDVAMEEALHLTHYGAKVVVFVRSDKLRASKVMQDRALAHPKIEFVRNTEVTEVLGNGKMITGAKLIKNKTGEQTEIELGGLFFAIGHTPNTSFLAGQVEADELGYILTKPGTTETNIPGVYAAGDVQDHVYRQAVVSAGTGCMAALSAIHRIESKGDAH